MTIGGSSFSAGALQDPLDTMEVFDPKTATFADAPYTLSSGRTWHASALVRDGTILAMGGYTISKKCDSIAATVDQIDPVKGTVTPFAVMPNVNAEWMAVTLFELWQNGQVTELAAMGVLWIMLMTTVSVIFHMLTRRHQVTVA